MKQLFQIACLAVLPTDAAAGPVILSASGKVAETTTRCGL